ncbi:beta-mannosidase mndA [Aspergillus mulundensis]|uniref:Beta-mannosidase A n=1 Tax=Aspergillus mulundensis TaxID=1810919 RepID=A0A3D8S593_9EURO|nr:Beta-mannosidase A [Aspergillus mulundensis]RDW81477.1 Beta-mannosidase A [Aspergillus mulundensis]
MGLSQIYSLLTEQIPMTRFREVATQALLASNIATGSGRHIDLSDVKWTLSSPALNITVPASLPSHVHLDLFKAGVIDDPYYGLNEIDLQWVHQADWTYTSDPIPDLLEEYESTWLVFEGLDTFATVTFCGKHIASTNNQFRQYSFDVSTSLRECTEDPVIRLDFASAPKTVNAIAADQSTPVWPVQLTAQLPNRWLMRKQQSDFGWDWGPAFAPSGPWKPAYVVQLEKYVYVLNTDLDIYKQGGINYLPPDQDQLWVVNASIDFIGSLPSESQMSIEIADLESGEILASQNADTLNIAGTTVTGVATLRDISPNLWWPSGLGAQNLYNVTITVHGPAEQTIQVTKRTGFRTIFLNQRNITDTQLAQGIAPGANWHFEVNGKEFYAKGSNFIPPDTFWPRVTKEKVTRLFDAVVAGNQNMLRIWSSGAYLPDFIYDLADERGILLWSEFQFSDAMYPVNEDFLDNVAEEVVYNVRRVNHHPSLALWAGGNEIESLMLPMTRDAAPDHYPKYLAEYEKLYISLILPLVYENSRSISYSPSSTTEGYLNVNLSAPVPMTQRYEKTEEGSYYGDTDYYNYNTAVSFDFSKYPVGRFANEFGFHSMPSLQAWRQVVEDEDLHFNSTTVVLRNRHYPSEGYGQSHNSSRGMAEMTLGVERYYPIPEYSDPVANFSAWCFATQLFQADFYKSQIQFYRRGSGMPERQLGSLYWQLEDIWQAPTWAGIEYDGRWKVLHYVARDIYQPIIVSPFWNYTTGDLEIYVTSDLWESASGIVDLTWSTLSGKEIVDNAGTPTTLEFTVGAINTTKIYSTNINDLNLTDPRNSILTFSLSSEAHLPNADKTTSLTHENYFTPSSPKDLALVDPQLELSYDAQSGTFTVEAKAGVSLYTWLDYPAGLVGYFTENAFLLVPGQKKEVRFVVQDSPEEEDWAWQDEVTVRSLWDQKGR